MAEQLSKEEQIGVHKGALSVLALEQQEFMKLLQVIQQQIESHVKALKDLGVDLEAEAKKAAENLKQQEASKADSGDDLADRLG
tara:strand:- start:407 stop:658 length:252 start_codon:yes stop_codon:yes gene_type:complete